MSNFDDNTRPRRTAGTGQTTGGYGQPADTSAFDNSDQGFDNTRSGIDNTYSATGQKPLSGNVGGDDTYGSTGRGTDDSRNEGTTADENLAASGIRSSAAYGGSTGGTYGGDYETGGKDNDDSRGSRTKPSFGDKVKGTVEELVGQATRNEERIQHGKDTRSGDNNY